MNEKEVLMLKEKAKGTDMGPILEKHIPDLSVEMPKIHQSIIKILKKFCDLNENDYNIIALWIIGTHFHKEFETFPYLFFNAMKGSGKTRLLKLIKEMAWNGKLVGYPSEAVLFRTAGSSTICLDEFEHIGNSEKGILREILNSAYKKGMAVERLKKVKRRSEDGMGMESVQEVESFEVYGPIAMANINGMESVLGDRCISLILDKSSNKRITRLIEAFSKDRDILSLKSNISVVSVMKLGLQDIDTAWNDYIGSHNNTDTILHNYTHNTHNTNDTNYILFEKIEKTSLDGRHLELFFPLFVLADKCDVLDQTILMAEKISSFKKGDDRAENRDVSLIEFISKYQETDDFIMEKTLLGQFKNFLNLEERDEEYKDTNSKWLGRAMKRLNLVIEKRRMSNGMEIRINFSKAKDKIRPYQEEKIQDE